MPWVGLQCLSLVFLDRTHLLFDIILLKLTNNFREDFRLYNGSNLMTYLLMRWLGPDALTVVRPTGVYQLDFFGMVFSFMYC